MSRDLTRSFLEDICANPDDDAPRLIFADWLDEHGKAGRAEFIRVQVRRASLPWWHADQIGLSLRERALLAQYRADWVRELPELSGVEWAEFRRGFVAVAEFADFGVLREHAAECQARAPVERVSIRWPREAESAETIPPMPGLRELSIRDGLVVQDEANCLADAPLLSTLAVLDLPECNLFLEGLERVLRSPHLARLTALRAPLNSIGNGGITALYKAASLTRLTELDLSEAGSYGRYGEDPIIDVVGMASLANWPGLANLRKLSLSGNDLKKGGLQALLLSRHARNLKELYVRDNGLKGSSMDAFASANPELRLEVLDVSENLLRDRGASGLKNAHGLADAKVLRIERCEMTEAGVRTLGKAPCFANLRRLEIDGNNIGSDGIAALLDAMPPHLHALSARDSALDDLAVRVLADSPDSDGLLELDLSENELEDSGADALSGAKHLKGLRILRLRNSLVGGDAQSRLRDSELGTRLDALDLG